MTDIEKLLKNADRDPMFLASKEYAEMREYYTDDANKVEYDMDKAIEEMTIKVQEDQDNFIFEILSSFLEEKTELKFNKQLLIDAVTEFKEKHPERFEEEQADESEIIAEV